ncbi:MAG TPA: uroporphyrinogen-III C-methyltransferase [Candidatus Limnocylindria bacterium]|nr:uroporphyrinogen-III C-methyltransferase [Candidatus Limnocylindria bacterium]
MKNGTVYLVGAGPGDAGLLTLRGAELLGRADVVVYDALVNPDLLRLAPRSAEIIYGGKRAKDHAIPQNELNALLVEKARAGKTVVRLKGGDPYIFGRGGEEAEELAAAKIPFEVVPGISSIVAGPNYAGIPLTHRDHCSSFTVITGHEDPTKEEAALDWNQIAKLPGTKVILMGVERIREIAASLMAGGMATSTPVGMIRWGTTGRQQSIEGTLETIADVVVKEDFKAPAVTIIGGVVTLRDKLNWFESRPLFGQRIVVTRTREQASQLSSQLTERGAEVLEIPTIRIEAPDDRQTLVEAMSALGEYDWVIFTSPNGMTQFFDYFFKSFEDIRALGGLRIAAVGPATAAKLKELHLKVDLMPEEYLTNKIAEAFKDFQDIENLRLLLLRAQVANPDLVGALEAMGGIVDDVAVYKTVPETEDRTGAAARLLEEGADWITFTSSSTVENFHARFNLPELIKKFPKLKTASIGPETSKAIRALDLEPTLEAGIHTIDGLVKTIMDAQKQRAAAKV